MCWIFTVFAQFHIYNSRSPSLGLTVTENCTLTDT